MNKDITNKLAQCLALSPVSVTASTTSSLIDTKGFEALDVQFVIGAMTGVSAAKTFTLSLEESDTTAAADFTAVAAANTVDNAASILIDDIDEDDKVYNMGYIGTKRYVRAKITVAGAITANISSIVGQLGHAREEVESDVSPVTAT